MCHADDRSFRSVTLVVWLSLGVLAGCAEARDSHHERKHGAAVREDGSDAKGNLDDDDGGAEAALPLGRCGSSEWRVAFADPECDEPGCLRSARFVGDYTRGALVPLLEPSVSIDNGYAVVALEYQTGDRTSLATVTIPHPCRPPPAGYAVVVNAHGTVGLDDPCRLTGTSYAAGLAGLFGARGVVGVAPDYPGLGTPGVSPYLVREVEGTAVLDALRATRALLRHIEVPSSHRYAVVGLSQGGHATLAAAALHQSYAPELNIRAFAAAAPASAWLSQWRRGVRYEGPHIAYHAMLIYAWAEHYRHAGSALWTQPTAQHIDSIMREACSFDFGGARSTYRDQLGDDPEAIFDPAFLSAYRAGELSELAPSIEDAFASNALGPFEQTAPLAIWQGGADTTVLPEDTAELVASLRSGGVDVEHHQVAGAGHLETAFGFVTQAQAATEESIAWVKAALAR